MLNLQTSDNIFCPVLLNTFFRKNYAVSLPIKKGCCWQIYKQPLIVWLIFNNLVLKVNTLCQSLLNLFAFFLFLICLFFLVNI